MSDKGEKPLDGIPEADQKQVFSEQQVDGRKGLSLHIAKPWAGAQSVNLD